MNLSCFLGKNTRKTNFPVKVFLLFSPFLLFSQSAFSFLTLSQNANGMAAGNSFIIASKETPQEFIPSLLKERSSILITASQFTWLSDISSKNIFLNSSYKKLAFGLMAKYFEIADIEERDKASLTENSKFENYYAMFAFSLSYPLTEYLSIGGTYKLLREKNYIYNSDGSAFDFSLSYQNDRLTSFLSGNTVLGNMERLSLQGTKLSQMFNLGAHYQFDFISLGMEYHLIEYFPNELSISAEKDLTEWFSVKTGYWFNHDVRSISLGAEISYYSLHFSYSYASHKYLDAYQLMQISLEL